MNKKSIELKFNKYLNDYFAIYDKKEAEYIKSKFINSASDISVEDILLQIYSELGVISKSNNRYYEYLSILEKNFDIRKNILEIGGGYIPAFSNILARKQLKLGSGSVTVFDPVLITTNPKYKNMKLVKDKATINTIVEPYDLIVGIMPCEATELILDLACKNKKDFFLALCGCSHFDFFQSMIYGKQNYQEHVIDYAKRLLGEYNNGELCCTELPKKYDLSYPIIYNKKS